MARLDTWERPYYEPGGGDAVLFYVVYGDLKEPFELSRLKYRSDGVPAAVEVTHCRRPEHIETFESFFEAGLDRQLDAQQPGLSSHVRAAGGCIIIQGRVPDPADLSYLRDTIGLVTSLLDNGGIVLLDLLTFRWWEPVEWRRRIFDPNGPVPTHHADILLSDEEGEGGGVWAHTRGMVKFGRPDLSMRHVLPEELDAVTELFNRFIALQAFGHIIPEGRVINMAGLPQGLTCRHGGDHDDPEFNNVHVEIRRPH